MQEKLKSAVIMRNKTVNITFETYYLGKPDISIHIYEKVSMYNKLKKNAAFLNI
jgi:hypothetical protein